MGKMLRFEFRKIFRQKSLYVCLIIGLLMSVLNIIVMSLSNDHILSGDAAALTALTNSSFKILVPILVSLYACDDFSNNTLKNIYSRGCSRTKAFAAKFLVSSIVTVLLSAIFIAVSFGLSLVMGAEPITDVGKIIVSLACQLVLVFGYQAVYFGISMITASAGISIAINIAGPTLIVGIGMLVLKFLKIESVNIENYWLDSSLINLMDIGYETADVVKAIVKSVAYAVVFGTIGCLVSKKREI